MAGKCELLPAVLSSSQERLGKLQSCTENLQSYTENLQRYSASDAD